MFQLLHFFDTFSPPERWNASPRRSAAACIVALVLIAGAVVLARALPILAQRSPMILFWPIIGFASYFGGVGSGLFAGVLSVFACWYFVVQPPVSLSLLTGPEIGLVLVSLSVTAVVFLIVSTLRRALAQREFLVRQLRHSEVRARLLRRESQHRIANSLQTVSSVEDDGVGLPQPLGRRGSGIAIVEALAAQLGGQFRFVQVPTGTLAEVTFGRDGNERSGDRPEFDDAPDLHAGSNLRAAAGPGRASLAGVLR